MKVDRLGHVPLAYYRGQVEDVSFPDTSAGRLAGYMMPRHNGTNPWTTDQGTALFTVAIEGPAAG